MEHEIHVLALHPVEVELIFVTPRLDRLAGYRVADRKRVGHRLRPEAESIEPNAVGASEVGAVLIVVARTYADEVLPGSHADATGRRGRARL